MKVEYIILLFTTLISCNDDINNSNYRNSNYVYYEENDEPGEWRVISQNSNNDHKPGSLTYFFDNGEVYAVTKIIDNFSNRTIDFYDKGKAVTTYFYENNTIIKKERKDGFQTEYQSNKGIPLAKGLFKNNKEQGEWEEYDENGNLSRIANYKDSLRHGKFREFYQDGSLKTIGKMWHGKKKDTIKWFYNGGNLKIMEISTLDTIKKTSSGNVIHYYNSGILHKKITVINEKRNGISNIYYENGIIKSISNYTNDMLNGEGFGYHENGNISYKGYTINDKVHGDFYFYDQKGIISKKYNYNQGVLLDSIIY